MCLNKAPSRQLSGYGREVGWSRMPCYATHYNLFIGGLALVSVRGIFFSKSICFLTSYVLQESYLLNFSDFAPAARKSSHVSIVTSGSM